MNRDKTIGLSESTLLHHHGIALRHWKSSDFVDNYKKNIYVLGKLKNVGGKPWFS